MAELLEILSRQYGLNEPIFEKTIRIKGLSQENLRQSLVRLVSNNSLKRFSRGIFYIPTDTPFGPSRLNVEKVVERKYLGDKTDRWGFYTALKLENLIGLSEQVPSVWEIVTNIEKSRCREIILGAQKLRLRRPRIPITPENTEILQFLELLNLLDLNRLKPDQLVLLQKFVRNQKLQKSAVNAFLPFFPSRTAKNMILTGVIHELA